MQALLFFGHAVRRVQKLFGVLVISACTSLSVAAADYIRLVDSNPVPPLSVPEHSMRTVALSSILELVANAGPLFNQSTVFGKLQESFDVALKEGLEEAARQGQAGALLRLRVFEQKTDAGPFYTLLGGKGVVLVGVGMDPDAALYGEVRSGTITAGIPPAGAVLAEPSGYVWVTKDAAKMDYVVSRYRADRLEERARVALATQESRRAYEQARAASAVEGYAKVLLQRIQNAESRKAVEQLLKSQQEALTELADIETKLAAGLRKARRAAKTSAMLDSIAGALSLASTIAMASASLGEDLLKSPEAPFSSKETVRDAVERYGQKQGQEVQSLDIRRTVISDRVKGTRVELFTIGVQYQMTPPERTLD